MRVNGKMGNIMEKVYTEVEVQNMKEILKKGSFKDEVYSLGHVVQYMKDNLKNQWRMEKENSVQQLTEKYMEDFGKMEN